ncbi:hypothetical protein [Butyricimonas sp. Marseille-P3923]|uniref:hypothetical protein n=1 Tax=Butyricimonas sp. Marseille-P3923 TaxID=1987504 RepID=UPI001145A06E|nr:hypothetical protein [Butyricimonas sp. Marseille-P3923]
MKRMKLGMLVLLVYLLLEGCQDVEIGFLVTEYASYSLDSMVIRKELDATEPYWGLNPEYEEYLNKGWTPELIKTIFPNLKPMILLGAGVDYYRVLNKQPWTGSAIEGIEGSTPIWVRVKEVKSTNGNTVPLMECISVRGNGIIEVPLKNDIPVGRYLVSLTFWNEGWSKDVDDCFTIIVK